MSLQCSGLVQYAHTQVTRHTLLVDLAYGLTLAPIDPFRCEVCHGSLIIPAYMTHEIIPGDDFLKQIVLALNILTCEVCQYEAAIVHVAFSSCVGDVMAIAVLPNDRALYVRQLEYIAPGMLYLLTFVAPVPQQCPLAKVLIWRYQLHGSGRPRGHIMTLNYTNIVCH